MFKRSIANLSFLDGISKKNDIFFTPTCINVLKSSDNKNFFELPITLMTNTSTFKNSKHIVSSSGSAIVSMLLSIGYTPKAIYHKLNNADFSKIFKSYNHVQTPLSIIIDNQAPIFKNNLLKRQFKCLEKDEFLAWAKQQIAIKLRDPLATFSDLELLAKKDLTVKNIHLIALNVEKGKLVILNSENTPDLPIAIAVRICMSFFTIFPVVEINDIYLCRKYIYADGGLVLEHFDLKRHKIAC